MSAPYVVETSGLTKRFHERVAVDEVDLRVPPGSAFGYLGPNGAGKTTLIRMLLGLTRPTAGTMRLLGRPVPAERAAALARVGAIVEEPRFHRYLSGRQNLVVIAAAREREAQPTNGLDPAGMHEFRGMIRALVAEGRTVLLSSHLLDEVEKICDAVAIVDHGRVVMQGSLAELTLSRQTILIGASDRVRAQGLLAAHPAVRSAAKTPEGIRVTLRPGFPMTAEDAAADINRFLVEARLAVYRIEPARASL